MREGGVGERIVKLVKTAKDKAVVSIDVSLELCGQTGRGRGCITHLLEEGDALSTLDEEELSLVNHGWWGRASEICDDLLNCASLCGVAEIGVGHVSVGHGASSPTGGKMGAVGCVVAKLVVFPSESQGPVKLSEVCGQHGERFILGHAIRPVACAMSCCVSSNSDKVDRI